MKDSLITKNKSLSLKFIAATLMVLLHTFAFPERIDSNLMYISLFKINGIGIEVYVGRFGSICVGMFIFLSGYGLYVVYRGKASYQQILKRIYKFYLNYWIIFLLFIPIGIYKGKYIFRLKELTLNFGGIIDSYNGEWWFIRLYIMLLISFPIIVVIINKYNKNTILIVSFIMNILGYGLTKLGISLGITSGLIALLGLFLGGQFLFIFSIIIAKEGLFDKLSTNLNINKKIYWILLCITMTTMILIMDIPIIGEVSKLILIPIFIFILTNILSEQSIISKLGKHSTNIWLTHSFFCYYLFQQFTFALKYSMLIFIQLMVVTIIISVIVNKIIDILNSIMGMRRGGIENEKSDSYFTNE